MDPSNIKNKKFAKKLEKQKQHLQAVYERKYINADEPDVLKEDVPGAIAKKVKWTNKQRVLVFASRGASYRTRFLLRNFRFLMPQGKPECKKDDKDDVSVINEIAEMKNCNKCIYLETRKTDLYMWMSNITRGPSVKFLVQNVHTMRELKMTGNCLKGSRPLLCFDKNFDEPHWLLMKELITQIMGTPSGHPKSKPFFDHVFVFSIDDRKIWFRNYQIVEEDGQLTEIGPRFVLNPIKIFEGSFGGVTLWSNEHYLSPSYFRSMLKYRGATEYVKNVTERRNKLELLRNLADVPLNGDSTGDIFETKLPEKVIKKIETNKKIKTNKNKETNKKKETTNKKKRKNPFP